MVTAAAVALVEDDGWRQHFEDALSTPGSERWVFDRARVHLLYGERLRRARVNTDARAHLLLASEGFERVRADPWADRARAKGGATGAAAPPDRAFLSARTVSTHLYRVFPQLGISTRSALHDAMHQPPDAGSPYEVIDAVDGPVVLVGHSDGGAVVTEAGTHPSVAALVHITAFVQRPGRISEHRARILPAGRPAAPDPAAC